MWGRGRIRLAPSLNQRPVPLPAPSPHTTLTLCGLLVTMPTSRGALGYHGTLPPFISLPVPAPLYTAPSLTAPPPSPSLQVPSVCHLDSVSNASQSQIPFFIRSFSSPIHISLLFADIIKIYVFNRKLAGNEGADMSLFSN